MDLAALRVRVEASGGPSDAPANLAKEWVIFSEATSPLLKIFEDGIFLDVPSDRPLKEAYSWAFEPVWDRSAKRMMLKCRASGCMKTIAYQLTSEKGSVFNFTPSPFDHLKRCFPRSMLRRVDHFSSAGGAGAKRRALDDDASTTASTSAGAGAGGYLTHRREPRVLAVKSGRVAAPVLLRQARARRRLELDMLQRAHAQPHGPHHV